MNKKLFGLLSVCCMALVLGFTSCKQEDPAEPLNVNMDKYATIQGTVLINKNTSLDADAQRYSSIRPDDFILTTVIRNAELNALAGASSGNWTRIFTGKEYYNDTDGTFTIKVPVGEEPTSVKLVLSDVITNWIRTNGDMTENVKARWNLPDGNVITVTLSEGQVLVLDEWILEPKELEVTDRPVF